MPAVRGAGLECPRCAALFDGPPIFTGCPHCRAQHLAVNLGVKVDLSPLAGFVFLAAAFGAWRIGLRHYGSTGS